MITATRYHDFCAGHKVSGHENKCAHLHGHNYRIHFTVEQDSTDALDNIGRVVDFSIIKERLCEWLENEWDHRFLLYIHDPLQPALIKLVGQDIVLLPFNPTAENMAKYLCEVIAPKQLKGTGCKLIKCQIDETRKCSATYEITG